MYEDIALEKITCQTVRLHMQRVEGDMFRQIAAAVFVSEQNKRRLYLECDGLCLACFQSNTVKCAQLAVQLV